MSKMPDHVESNCHHLFEINDNKWDCQNCDITTSYPWAFKTPRRHKHDWTPSEIDGWTTCNTCQIEVECDHNCGTEVDTIEEPYFSFNGIETRTFVDEFCVRCNTPLSNQVDYDFDEYEPAYEQ